MSILTLHLLYKRFARAACRPKAFALGIIIAGVFISGTIATLPPPAQASHGGFHLITCGTAWNIQGATQPGMGLFAPLCTICDFFALFQSILSYAWTYLVIPIAAIMMLYAGFLMIVPGIYGEQSAGQFTKGKKVLKNVVIGLAIIFFSWLIVDTIIKTVGGKLTASGTQAPFGPWNRISCTGSIPDIGGGIPELTPPELLCPVGTTEKDVHGFNVCDPLVKQSIEERKSLNTPNSLCSHRKLDPYASLISDAAGSAGIDPVRLQALILTESGGFNYSTDPNQPLNIRSPANAYGMTQVLPSTARGAIPALRGQSDAQVIMWLSIPANSLKAGAVVYASCLRSTGGNHDLAAACYNGGPGANTSSKTCPGQTWWQCAANGGYAETRRYVPKMNEFESRLRGGTCM